MSKITINEILSQLKFPSTAIYLFLVRRCTINRSLQDGRLLHNHILTSGHLHHSIHLGNLLIKMYRKLGSVTAARAVFDRMPKRDIVSWGSIIAAYAQSGHSTQAISLFHQMDLKPNEMVIVSTLAACSALGDLSLGTAIHAKICGNPDLRNSIFVGTALVNMYGKCHALESAREVFEEMPYRDVVAWTAMVTAYAQLGHSIQALETVERMIRACVQPNPVTFVAAITACSSKELVDRGRELHAEVIRRGLHRDTTIQNALVSMYARGGRAEAAAAVFHRMERRNRVSWNSMVAALASGGQWRAAVEHFFSMSLHGIKPDDVSFLAALNACSGTGCLGPCRKIHSLVEIAAAADFRPDLSVENALLTAYAKCGDLAAAERTFARIAQKNVVSWTAMLTAYTFHGHGNRALELYQDMVEQSIQLDSVALLNVVYAGSLAGDLRLARELHSRVAAAASGGGIQLQNALITMYSRCGSPADARRVFYSIERKNLVSWNAMMGCYLQHGRDEEVVGLFQEMRSGKSSATSKGSILRRTSPLESATPARPPDSISDTGFQPDCVTAVIVLAAYAGLGELAEGRKIHAELCASNPAILDGGTTATAATTTSNVTVGNALVSMYARCGSLDDAAATFERMTIRDTVSWSSLVAGLAHHGDGGGAIAAYRRMHLDGVPPDSVTYVSILSSCSRAGLVDQARFFFRSMVEDIGLAPWAEHWKCMVDVLGRAGFVGRAEELVRSMPFQPDVVAWNTLLGCCKVHGDPRRAAAAARNATGISPAFPGSALLLSNLYAEGL